MKIKKYIFLFWGSRVWGGVRVDVNIEVRFLGKFFLGGGVGSGVGLGGQS